MVAKKKVKKSKKKVVKKVSQKKVTSSYDIAYEFALQCYSTFKEAIKTIAVFGSVAKQSVTQKSDIDLLIILDDCTIQWDQELIAWYRSEIAKIIAKHPHGKKLHVNTVTLTSFWEEVKAGEPVAMNVLRHGKALIDFGGFFEPLKVLLAKGRIRPSPEAVFTTMQRSLQHFNSGRAHILRAVDEYYWTMIDSAHAALMAEGEVPPSPEHVASFLDTIFVKTKRMDKKYMQWYEDIRKITKKIAHREIYHIPGKHLEIIEKRSELFAKHLQELTKKLIKHKKIVRVEEKV